MADAIDDQAQVHSGVQSVYLPYMLGAGDLAQAGAAAAAEKGRMDSLVDRMDALLTLIRQCPLPELGAVTGMAESLVGCVLRDAGYLEDRLERLPEGEVVLRTSLTAAMGLLGHPPDVELARPEPADPKTATAYAAAVALGEDDQRWRVKMMDSDRRRATGRASSIFREARLRFGGGERLAILD